MVRRLDMRPALVAAFCLIAAACVGDEGAQSTTTLELGASTSTPATTIATTTTTLAPTTTALSTTTTEAVGNWAGDPLVVATAGALGWWDGSSWIQAEAPSTLPVSGGEDYQVVRLGVSEVISGGPQIDLCEFAPIGNVGVELSDTEPLAAGDAGPGPGGLAISAPWELTPHPVEEETAGDEYSEFARPLLAAHGLQVANPHITQVIRFDLEGDGVDEVVAVAEEITGDEGIYAEDGNYSLVFMRKVVDGAVQTSVLSESIVTDLAEGETPFILSQAVAAIADLSGDGKMEIVLHGVYYEGMVWGVWEYVNDDLGPLMQIATGCGL
jgi:hypothetical protein